MKKIIVISAINLHSGGPLSVLDDCLRYLDKNLWNDYKIVALVHDKSILSKTKNVTFIEFPKSVMSYIYRFYYEYVYFKKLSKELKPYLWLSLHDITPRVNAKIQAVYCHNPSPFYKVNLHEVSLDIKFTLFSLFYKYLYKINIKKNDFVIVQQEWMRKKFLDMYNIKKCIVSYPLIKIDTAYYQKIKIVNTKKVFFYPSFPRVFKNFEVICEAVKLLNIKGIENFEVVITIDGTENKYSKYLFNKYKDLANLIFVGLQTREKIFDLYNTADCLIFPSKLETWGLPISEFKEFKKTMFLSDLGYAHEALGKYDYVKYFSPNSAGELSILMNEFIGDKLILEQNSSIVPAKPFTKSWKELFNLLLKGDMNEKY
jgi:hypothetical protein